MRSTRPTLHCDGDDGWCEAWAIDFYEETVETLGGVRITAERRAPGWVSTNLTDLCPEHAEAVES